jgi:MFS family permease
MLTGILYTLPFAFTGLFFGKLAETSNRKIALGLVILSAGASMAMSGFSSFFWVLAAMRILHGAINSAANPFSFSLVSDYFPPDKRATANSMIHSG